jgi:surface antigen
MTRPLHRPRLLRATCGGTAREASRRRARRSSLMALAAIACFPLSGCVAVAPLFMAAATTCGVTEECKGRYPQEPSLVSQLDGLDTMLAKDASQRALETLPDGYPATWSNPESGASGSLAPLATYKVTDPSSPFTHCRDYRGQVWLGTQTGIYEGRACRDSRTDGWVYVNGA